MNFLETLKEFPNRFKRHTIHAGKHLLHVGAKGILLKVELHILQLGNDIIRHVKILELFDGHLCRLGYTTTHGTYNIPVLAR